MKREADLIRSIALATEELPGGKHLSELAGIEPHAFAMHVQWMIDAGLIEGRITKFMGSEPPAAVVFRLTWAGCDFLDAARSNTLWAKAKSSVIAPTMSWTFDILKDWLKAEIKSGLPTFRALAD